MNNKVSRYQLLFADEHNELKFKQFNEVMFQLQREMVQIANREVQILWEDMNWSNAVKVKTGAYPTKDEVLEHYGCPVMTHIYRNVAQEYNNTANTSVLQRNINKRFVQNKKEVMQGKRSIDSYKSTLPIAIHGNSIKIEKLGNKYLVSLSLLSNGYKKQLGVKKGTAHLKFSNDELLKRFNIYACLHRNWLPPTYGKKQYADMTDEEKAVVDEFQGAEDYEKVMRNPSYYLSTKTNLLQIGE